MRALLFLALVFGTSLMPQEGPFQRFTAVAWPQESVPADGTGLGAVFEIVDGIKIVSVYLHGNVSAYSGGTIAWDHSGGTTSTSITNAEFDAGISLSLVGVGCSALNPVDTPSGSTMLQGGGYAAIPAGVTEIRVTKAGRPAITITVIACGSAWLATSTESS